MFLKVKNQVVDAVLSNLALHKGLLFHIVVNMKQISIFVTKVRFLSNSR